MKIKLHAGAELETLTAAELRGELRAWSGEVLRGARFRRRSWIGEGAGAALQIRGDGPAEGFVWAVTRLTVSGAGFDPLSQKVNVYLNEATPTQLQYAELNYNAFPGDHGIIVEPGDALLFAVTGTVAAGAQVIVTATVKEVPALMQWAL